MGEIQIPTHEGLVPIPWCTHPKGGCSELFKKIEDMYVQLVLQYLPWLGSAVKQVAEPRSSVVIFILKVHLYL